MKSVTLPNLELPAALLASRLQQEVQCAIPLNIERLFMWTDSTTVLQWLHLLEKTTRLRCQPCEFLELTTVDAWNHVPTPDNPADNGTRGLSATVLFRSCWLGGHDFPRSFIWPFLPSTDLITKI